MKKICVLLCIAIALTSLNFTVAVADESAELLLFEDFEGDEPLKFYDDRQTAEYGTVESLDIYGIGKAFISPQKATVNTSPFEKTYLMPEVQGFNPELKNCYVETEFDAVIKESDEQCEVAMFSYGSTDGTNIISVRFSSGGKIQIGSKSEKRIGSNRYTDVCSYEYQKAYRIKAVFRVSDENGNSCEKLTAFYVNGENVLTGEHFMKSANAAKVGCYEALRVIKAGKIYLDNIRVLRYTSQSGISPAVDKGRLVSLIRNTEETSENREAVLNAKAVYENSAATGEDVNSAINRIVNGESDPPLPQSGARIIVSEDFEGDSPRDFYVDGSPWAYTPASYTESYGLNKVYTHQKGQTYPKPYEEKIYLKESEAGYSDNEANLYSETEFDIIIKQNVKANGEYAYVKFIDARSAQSAQKGAMRISFKGESGQNGGMIQLGAFLKSDPQTEVFSNLQEYELNRVYRIKVVMRITDENRGECGTVEKVYINGENKLNQSETGEKYCVSPLVGVYDSLRLAHCTHINFDNLTVTKYTSETLDAPFGDKGKLIFNMREAYDYIKAAKSGGFSDENIAEMNECFSMAETVYKSDFPQDAEINGALAELEKIYIVAPSGGDTDPISYYINNDFESGSMMPFPEAGAAFAEDSAPITGKVLKIGGSSSGVTIDASGFTGANILGEKTDSYTDFDFCPKNLVGSGGSKIEFKFWWSDSSDKTPISKLYLNGANGTVELQYPSNEIKTLTEAGTIENNRWYNLRFVIHTTDNPQNVAQRPTVSVYLDGKCIANKLYTQSYSKGKCDYYNTLTVTTAAGTGLLADNFKIYEIKSTDDFTSPNNGALKAALRSAYKKLENAVTGTGEDEYEQESVDALKSVYESVYAKFSSTKIQMKIDSLAEELNAAIAEFKPCGKRIKLESAAIEGEQTLLGQSRAKVRATVSTNKYANSQNTAYIFAVLMGKGQNGESVLKAMRSKIITVGADSSSEAEMEFDISSFSDGEKADMYIEVFAAENLTNLSAICTEPIYLCKEPSEETDESIRAEKPAQIIREYNGTELRTVIRASADANSGVIVVVFDDEESGSISESNIKYALWKRANKNGACDFELKLDNGKYNYCTNFGASGSISYANTAETNRMLSKISATNFEEMCEYLGVDLEVYSAAKTNGVDTGDILEKVLSKGPYSCENINSFSVGINTALESLCSIVRAVNVDTVNSSVEKLSVYLSNYGDFAVLSDSAKRIAGSYILKNKNGAKSITMLNALIPAAVGSVGGGTVSGGGAGGGGGASGGGSANVGALTLSEKPNPAEKTPAEKQVKEFSDLKRDHWAFEMINCFAALNFVNGNENDEFMPDKAISREEFVKLVVCVFELKRTNEFKGYSDVPGDKWFSEYVAAAVENEIINGVGENRFGTGETLSRSDMAVIVHRLLKKLGLRLTEGGIYIEFDDETLIAGYALEAVKALAAGGIINGSGNNCFEPTKSCTRAEAVKMLYELYMTK